MKFLILFAFVSVLALARAQTKSCTELEQDGENGIRKMFIQEEGAVIPKTKEELEARCAEGKKLFRTMLDYKTCLKALPQQIYSTTSQSVGKLLKKNCATEEGKATALKLLQCATPEKVKLGQQCAVGSLDAIYKLSESKDSKEQLIGKACCLAHVAVECARSKLGQIKCDDPTLKPIDHFEEALQVLSKDALEIACDQYKDIGACRQKIPDAVKELEATVNTQNHVIGDRKLIAPMLKLAERVAN